MRTNAGQSGDVQRLGLGKLDAIARPVESLGTNRRRGSLMACPDNKRTPVAPGRFPGRGNAFRSCAAFDAEFELATASR